MVDKEYEAKASALDVIDFMTMDNIASEHDMTDQELRDIGNDVIDNYEDDDETREEWKSQNEDALKLAKQVRESKSFPWVGAANIKYPLISEAALKFNSRAYPEIVQGEKVVKAVVVGKDTDQTKADRAERISSHMSYQLMETIPNWESDTDKLTIMLPIVGTMFREVQWDEINLRPEINLLMPDELIVNYHAKSLDLTECRRISREITFFMNDIKERERAGLWLKRSYVTEDDDDVIEEDEQVFIQQCCYLDLDKDDYSEPYIVTVHKDSKEVVRIVALYDETTVKANMDTGEITKIEPLQMYTDYHFIPAFDGGFYSTGFGSYLFPMNQTIDTLINQIVDAGTLSNLQSGFIGKGLRTKAGSTPFQPGEWRPVDSKGGDMRNNIIPLPTKEPSMVLYQALVFLIDTGKSMSGITDVMNGVPQGQNTPVGTTMAMIEQGMKVIDAIYKRIYLALKKEYKMLYRINQENFANTNYQGILDDEQATQADYESADFDIIPVGDSRISSQIMRTMKAQAARDIAMSTPGANVTEASRLVLESMDVPQEQIDLVLPKQGSPQEMQQMIEQLQGQIETYQQYVDSGKMQLAQDENNRKNATTDSTIKKDQATTVKTLVEAEKIKSETEGQDLENDLIETGAMEAMEAIQELEV
jgi:chaperonin GroES